MGASAPYAVLTDRSGVVSDRCLPVAQMWRPPGHVCVTLVCLLQPDGPVWVTFHAPDGEIVCRTTSKIMAMGDEVMVTFEIV